LRCFDGTTIAALRSGSLIELAIRGSDAIAQCHGRLPTHRYRNVNPDTLDARVEEKMIFEYRARAKEFVRVRESVIAAARSVAELALAKTCA
jgi:hypothetical protein